MPAGEAAKVEPLRPKRSCPECGKPAARATYPFCSERCKNIDLNRWLSGTYVIPGPPMDEDDDGVSTPPTEDPDY
ncbi:MAG: DNA gyrase inhibitor YacG [Pseudomonadota bacterium]